MADTDTDILIALEKAEALLIALEIAEAEVARLNTLLKAEQKQTVELLAWAERLKAHDVSHPGPCCVREVLRVDIKGRALKGGRE